jgi:ABC-type bacteriocin/lantibiotic exporter with double-glycine peptidase domain
MARRRKDSDSRRLTDEVLPRRFSTLSMLAVMFVVVLLIAGVIYALMVWLIAQEGWPS